MHQVFQESGAINEVNHEFEQKYHVMNALNVFKVEI